MTVDSRPDSTASSAGGPSIHVQRARKLMLGGAAGGVGASLLCLVGFTLGYGTAGLVSAALAAAMVLFFYGAGQYVILLFADAGARLLLAVAMASYTTRVALIGLVLLIYSRYEASLPGLVPMVVFLTVCAVVVGWLVVEVLVFSRLRITVYDTEYTGPRSQEPSL
jgi:hypothetical protein